MKQTWKCIVLAALLGATLAAHATTKELAEQYLRSTQMPEMLAAQVDAYTEQYAKGQDASYRPRMHAYLERMMGWDAVKDEYVSLVQSTYTEQEIRAFLRFVETPAGRSMKAKNIGFASKLAAISAKHAQDVATERAASEDAREELEVPASDLAIGRVEKFQSGDQVYFTGEIKNNGKRPARGVSIEADLFLGDRFVDQYSTYISGVIAPGASRLFKISCGCKGTPPAQHDSYKLQVLSGY